MHDAFERPLDPTPRWIGIACGVVCAIFTVCILFVACLGVADMLERRSLTNAEGDSLWEVALILGLIGSVTGFIAWRLLRGKKSANGITTLPGAFLQALGWLLLIFSIAVIVNGDRFTMLGASLALAMLLISIGRRVASHQRTQLEARQNEDKNAKQM